MKWYVAALALLLLAAGLWYAKKAVRTAFCLLGLSVAQAAVTAGIFLYFEPGHVLPGGASQWDAILTGLLLTQGLFFAAVVYAMEPLRRITAKIRELGEGNYEIKRQRYPRDDMGNLWFEVVRLAGALSVRQYQEGRLLKSCRRFVPEPLLRLLKKDSILDLEAGEAKWIQGAFGVVGVYLEDEVPGDGDYESALKESYWRISRSLDRCGGSLAGDSCSLSGFRILFREADAALSLTEELDWKTGNRYFTLLHWTNARYGVTGAGKSAAAFFISRELAFLNTFGGRLKEAGVSAVITEKLLERLERKPPLRYIGFVASRSKELSFRLYEVPGVYGEAGKRLKLDPVFQEGLSLYYQNDFYLARSRFSEVVRECPEDGIARWYVFASEYYFNAGGTKEPGYSLFDPDVKTDPEPAAGGREERRLNEG